MTTSLAEKQQQFNTAMDKFANRPVYVWVGRVVSFVNISLQVALLALTVRQSISLFQQMLTIAIAYILADFINGLVHMYMDNHDDYQSFVGPLVASFHLHHRTPNYTQKPLLVVYYHESGAKIWLAFFLLAAVAGVWQGVLTGVAAYGVFYFSIFSSLAEVSHYLCHIPSHPAQYLGKAGILLSSRHHVRHHLADNVDYAFLNGLTDPVLNLNARNVFPGYKNTTDLHYALYTGGDTENRS